MKLYKSPDMVLYYKFYPSLCLLAFGFIQYATDSQLQW